MSRFNRKQKFAALFAFAGIGLVTLFLFMKENKEQSFSKFRFKPVSGNTGEHKVVSNNGEEKSSERRPAQVAENKNFRNKTPTGPLRKEMPVKDSSKRKRALKFLKLRKEEGKALGDFKESGDFTNEQGSSFELVENMAAYESNADNEARFPNAPVVAGYLLVEEPTTLGVSLPVVRNLKEGNYAVFTGVLRIKFHDFRFESELAASYGAIIDESYDYIQTSLFRFDDYEQTIAGYRALKDHPAVMTVNVELLEYRRQPN